MCIRDRLKPTAPCTPAFETASATAEASAVDRPTGFSIQMCLPASAIATPISRCRKFGAVMLTACTRGSSTTSRQSRVVEAKPNCSAACSARPGTSSATVTSRGRTVSCGKWCGTRAYAWVCTRPIHPKPTTATPSEVTMTALLWTGP